jgi:hypothetical protein
MDAISESDLEYVLTKKYSPAGEKIIIGSGSLKGMTEVVIKCNKKNILTFKLRRKVNKVYLEYNSLFLCNLRKM